MSANLAYLREKGSRRTAQSPHQRREERKRERGNRKPGTPGEPGETEQRGALNREKEIERKVLGGDL